MRPCRQSLLRCRHPIRGCHRMMPRPQRGASGAGLGLRARPGGLGARLRALLGAASATEQTWDEVEEALIAADFGPDATLELVDAARERAGRGDPRTALAEVVGERLRRTSGAPFELGPAPRCSGGGCNAGKTRHREAGAAAQGQGDSVIWGGRHVRAAATSVRIWLTSWTWRSSAARGGPTPRSGVRRGAAPESAGSTRSSSTRRGCRTRPVMAELRKIRD